MYLKTLEIIGFKSFAERTRMSFEPGLIAIVGPNGCGKSNVSDAIRWVLGEQRPTALRCAKMSDVLFNGTDSRKPLGLAEVSITFADCEGILDTEFNEVTITRRVYRSGEGQYFLNKTPCRLKEIHRLLMGTGIGTTSYSVIRREGDRETASEKGTQLQYARLARPGDTRARVLLILRSLLKSPPRLPEGVIGVRSGLLQLLSHSRFGFVWRRVLQSFPHALCLSNKDFGMGHDFLRLLFRCLHQVFVVALLTEVKSLPKIASGLG